MWTSSLLILDYPAPQSCLFLKNHESDLVIHPFDKPSEPTGLKLIGGCAKHLFTTWPLLVSLNSHGPKKKTTLSALYLASQPSGHKELGEGTALLCQFPNELLT